MKPNLACFLSLAWLGSTWLASPLLAQSKAWIVDQVSGDFPNMQAAAAGAANGDTLLVRNPAPPLVPGGFEVVGKSLQIVADPAGPAKLTGPVRIRNLAANQSVVLRGFEVNATSYVGSGLEIKDCDGAVWVTDCDFRPGFNASGPGVSTGVLVLNSDCVMLNRVVARGSTAGSIGGPFYSSPGLTSTDSRIHVFDTSCLGGVGTWTDVIGIAPGSGSSGLVLRGGQAFLSKCLLQGGLGGKGQSFAGFCIDGGFGGHAVEFPDPAPAQLEWIDCQFEPGLAGPPGAGCPPATWKNGLVFGGQGASLAQIQANPGPSRGAFVNSPVREGQSATLEVRAPTQEFAFLIFSGAPATIPSLPTPSAALLVTSPFVFEALGLVPAGGPLTKTVPVGNLNPSLQFLDLYLQSVTVELVGLTTYFTAPVDLVVLDAAVP
jgi:hypothetical protein